MGVCGLLAADWVASGAGPGFPVYQKIAAVAMVGGEIAAGRKC